MVQDERITSTLKRATGHNWEQISSLYLWYRTRHSPMNQFCVYTPDDLEHCMPEAVRYFIPCNCPDLYSPGKFWDNWLHTARQALSSVQWVNVELDLLPPKPLFIKLPAGLFFLGEVHFFGAIKAKKIGSTGIMSLGLSDRGEVSVEAKQQVREFLGNQLDFNISLRKGRLDVGIEGENERWSTKLEFDPPKVKAELELPRVAVMKQGWKLMLDMSIVVEGEVGKERKEKAGSSSHFWRDANMIGGAAAIIAATIFSGGSDLLVAGAGLAASA